MTIEQNILARKEANEILSLAIDCAGDFSCPAAVLFWAQIMAYVQSVLSERLLPVRTVEKPNRPMTPDEMEDFNRSEMPWGRHQGMSISLIPLSYLFCMIFAATCDDISRQTRSSGNRETLMTRDEFNLCLKDFAERFPATIKWVRSLKQKGVPTLNSWFDATFQDLEFLAVLDVSQAIQAGTYELGPWQSIPATYRRITTELRIADAELSRKSEPVDLCSRQVKCSECRDLGLVMCWHTKTMAAARRYILGGPDVTQWYSCGVACSCGAGDRFASTAVQKGATIVMVERYRYDESRFVRLRGDQEIDRQALLNWAQNYKRPNVFSNE